MIGPFGLAAVLMVLASADCAFAGFRSHLGRDARLPDRRRTLRAAARGVAIGVVGIALASGVAVVELLPQATRQDRLDSMLSGGLRGLAVAGPAMAVIFVALAVYVLPASVSAKTVAMTLVLGPLTLGRPLVIVAVVAAGASPDPLTNLPVVGLVGLTCLLVEPVLGRTYRVGEPPGA